MALGLSLTAWACLAVLALLFTASIGMPGDGNQAMQATRMPMLVTLLTGALLTLGGLVASPVAFSLRRQSGAAAIALALLLLLLLLFGLSLLALRAASPDRAVPAFIRLQAIWQWTGVQR
jgi:hypothetical protein